MPGLAEEIVAILAEHAGQPVDYVALFMFLNTVAGGHYEERHTEAEIVSTLRQLLERGVLEAWQDGSKREGLEAIVPGQTTCEFRLRRA